MNIGVIAHNSKKNLMENFCLAYKRILSKHELYATGITGRRIEEVTKLKVHKFLPGSMGGDRQFTEMIERNSMDSFTIRLCRIRARRISTGLRGAATSTTSRLPQTLQRRNP